MNAIHAWFVRVLAIAAAAAIGTPLAVAAAPNPIAIQQCFVTVPKAMSHKASGTQIVYIVNGHKAAKKVTFLVGYRNADGHYLRRVTDVGTFGPGNEIDHHFDLFNDLTYGGKTTSSCKAVSVVWDDGTSWNAP